MKKHCVLGAAAQYLNPGNQLEKYAGFTVRV